MSAMEFPMQEHAVLLRAYARAQERCSRLLAEQAAIVERLEAQIVRLRGALPKRLHALLAPGRRRPVIPAGPAPADLRAKAGCASAAKKRRRRWHASWSKSPAGATCTTTAATTPTTLRSKPACARPTL